MNTFEARDLGQWRKWLARHHDSESEVWLVFHKRHTGRTCIAYSDALDEALCFGWIDSLIKRLDEECYARKFTPRKPDSRWSDVNRKRYAQLKASGRLMRPGGDRAPTDRGYEKRRRKSWPVPPYVREALAKHTAALQHFNGLAPSHRRHYIGWIDSAKQQETKRRRLREAIRLLSKGQKLGLK